MIDNVRLWEKKQKQHNPLFYMQPHIYVFYVHDNHYRNQRNRKPEHLSAVNIWLTGETCP